MCIQQKDHQVLMLDKKEYSSSPGIYFLFRNEEVVYVGQSLDIPSRLYVHFRSQTQGFTSYSVIPCEEAHLNDLEAFYILKFCPIGNKSVPQNSLYKQIFQIRRDYGLELPPIKRLIKENNIVPFGIIDGKSKYYDIQDFAVLIDRLVN